MQSTHRTDRKLAATAAALVLAAAVAPVLHARPAAAATAYPRTCVVKTYYATAAMETVVGTRTNCPGGRSTGRTSPYHETEVVDLSPQGPGRPGGPGDLPCEFTVPGCSPIPGPRH